MTGAPPVASPRLSLVPLAATLYWSTDLGLGEFLIHHGEIFRLKLAENIQGVPKKDLLWFFLASTLYWSMDGRLHHGEIVQVKLANLVVFFPELDHHISGTISNPVEFSWSKSMG